MSWTRFLCAAAVGMTTAGLVSWPWWLLIAVAVAGLLEVFRVPERIAARLSNDEPISPPDYVVCGECRWPTTEPLDDDARCVDCVAEAEQEAGHA
jgi:hypothetical protein